jgi:hypothetical protein
MAVSMSANIWAQDTRVDIMSQMTRTQATQVVTMDSKKVIPGTDAGLIRVSVTKGLQPELGFSLVTCARYSKISLQQNPKGPTCFSASNWSEVAHRCTYNPKHKP